jgi:hypothetical protein
MRLTELEPRWFDVPGVGTNKDGVTFLCPHCRQRRLGVQFANPIGGEPRPAMTQKEKNLHLERGTFDVPPGILWQRTGETFEDLTLQPSVDASKSGHWHGCITNGEVK